MSYALNIEFLNGVALARGKTPNLSPIWVWDEDAERNYTKAEYQSLPYKEV